MIFIIDLNRLIQIMFTLQPLAGTIEHEQLRLQVRLHRGRP